MIHITNTGLTITIAHTEPLECRDNLIKAISAAIRWYTLAESTYTNDTDNMYHLAELQENLVNTD